MKVKELIEKLKQYDPDDIVILSQDEEGNGFETLTLLQKMVWVPQSRSVEDIYDGEDGQKAVVLWP